MKARPEKKVFARKRDNYSKSKRKQLLTYLRAELENSSTHGIPYLVDSQLHWFERTFWAFSFSMCLGIVYYLLMTQYYRYVKTPTVMIVELDYFNWNISYPALSLCPLIKPDEVAFAALVNDTGRENAEKTEPYLWAVSSAGLDNMETLDLQSTEELPLLDPMDYSRVAASVFYRLRNDSLTTNVNWPISVDTAMTELGMCHVINSNVAIFDNPLAWNDPEVKYRKSNIELSVHERDFFAQIINYADVYKVFVHSPDETILITTPYYTYNIEGFMSFEVQVWSTKISPTLRTSSIKDRNCRYVDEPISPRYPVYSYNHCIIECRIQMIMNLCQCLPHMYKTLEHERVCDLGELACVMQYMKEITALSASPETISEFNDTWLPRSSRDCHCLNSCEIDVYQKDKDNFIPQTSMNRLRIGLSAFPKVRVMKDAIFSVYDLILRSGGVINLCIGTSVISIMETIVTFLRIPIYYLARLANFNRY